MKLQHVLRQVIQHTYVPLHTAQFPCQTQAKERCIRLVMETTAAVCGEAARDGFIRATFGTKSEIRSNWDKLWYVIVVKHILDNLFGRSIVRYESYRLMK